jgi:hypothetical protein
LVSVDTIFEILVRRVDEGWLLLFSSLLGLLGWDDGGVYLLENSLEDVQRHSLNIACVLLVYLELVDVGEVVNSAYA